MYCSLIIEPTIVKTLLFHFHEIERMSKCIKNNIQSNYEGRDCDTVGTRCLYFAFFNFLILWKFRFPPKKILNFNGRFEALKLIIAVKLCPW